MLSLAAVDELVSERGLRTPFVRMSRDGDLLSPSRFTRGGGAGAEIRDQVADDKVLAEFASGATLVLQGLHRTWRPIQSFSQALAAQLGHPVQVNAYITPSQNTGFAAHYDVHDVFVLQFAGRKRWRIHEPVLPLPLRDQPWQQRKAAVDTRTREAPLIDAVLEAGDMLYLPRGYIHAASSLDEISGHLTVGVHPVTRWRITEHIVAGLSDDAELRRSLPLAEDLSKEDVIEEDIAATISALHAAIDRFDRRAIARAIASDLAAATRPVAIRPFAHLAAATSLNENTPVRLRSGLRLTSRTEGEDFVLQLPDRELRFTAAQADAVGTTISGAQRCAKDLPGIDLRDALALIARLLREGVVVPE